MALDTKQYGITNRTYYEKLADLVREKKGEKKGEIAERKTVSGEIASFETDVEASVKALTVDMPYTVGGIGGVNILNSPAPALDKDFQKLRAFGKYAYPVGRQVNVGYRGADVPFDVLGYDEACLAEQPGKHVVSLLAHNVLSYGLIPFDPAQYLYAVTAEAWPDGMPAGTYNVTLNRGAYNGGTAQDGTYQFTTTKTIPVGGGIRHTQMGVNRSDGAYTKENLLTGTFTTYAADRVTVLESGLATTEGSEGTSLGTTTANNPAYKVGDYINFTQCNGHGAGRWSTSFMRQWLNGDASPMAWEPKTIWSRPMNTLPAGFLYDLDPALKAVLGKVRVRYALSIMDGYGYEAVEDIVTLQTMTDMGFGNNNGIAESPVDASGTVKRTTAYTLWQGTTQAERIKYEGATARVWWLSSSLPSSASRARDVSSSGALNNNYANNSYGAVPSLHIILDDSANAPLPIDFGEAGPVYGGTLDVTAGLLTSTLDENGDPLAVPQTYHLTPQQVTTLLGQNNIFADTGDVSVTYDGNRYTPAELEPELRGAFGRLYDMFPARTVSGSIVSFDDGAGGIPAKALTVDIPYTEGGVESVTVTRCGKNFISKTPTIQSATKDGLTLSYSNGLLSISGTATAADNFAGKTLYSASNLIKAGKYYFKDISPGDYFYQLGDKNGVFLVNGLKSPFTVNQEFYLRNIYCYYKAGESYNVTVPIMICSNWTDLESGYEPYNGETHTVTIPADFYGGTVDLVTGEGTSLYASDGTELAEPEKFTVDPVEILALEGINNVWSDMGDVSVTYRRDPTLALEQAEAGNG